MAAASSGSVPAMNSSTTSAKAPLLAQASVHAAEKDHLPGWGMAANTHVVRGFHRDALSEVWFVVVV